METLLSVIIIIVCILLVVVILLQNSKGGGLSGGFGGLGTNAQMFGVRRTTDALSKATVVLVAVLFFLCIVMEYMVISSNSVESKESILQQNVPQESIDQAPQSNPTEALPLPQTVPSSKE